MNTEGSASRNFLYSAMIWLTIADIMGLIAATEMVTPDFLGGIPWLVFGRVRAMHTNGMLLMWLSMMNIGAMYYIVPRLCGTKLYSDFLGNLTMLLWNTAAVMGMITLANGMTQAREYAELIWPIDVLIFGTLLLVAFNIFATILRRREKKLYVSLWYFTGTLIWFPFVYFIGNVMWDPFITPANAQPANLAGFPSGSLTGINDAIWGWFYGHNILGYWFTTTGVGIAYYMVPVLIRSPLYSHLLSMIGFWSIAFFYGLVGNHHLLQSPTPAWLKTIASLGSIGLFVPVLTFIANMWMTMRGNWGKIYESVPLKFFITGIIFYLITCVQGPLQGIQTFNRLIHFTNWIVGHAHVALLGTFTFFGMGVIYYVIPVSLKRRLWSPNLAEAQYWLTTLGFLIFFLSLQIAGLIQGAMWMRGDTVYAALPSQKPYYAARAIGGAMIVLAGFLQIYNVYKTATVSEPMLAAAPAQAQAPS